MNEMKYGELITKIRKKRSWVIVLTIAAVLLLLILGSPIYIKAFGRVIVDYPGFPIALTVLLILLCLFVEIMVLAVVSAPIQASLDQECDPEKHFILNTYLNKPKYLNSVYSTDYLYLGAYAESKKYAELLIQSTNVQMVLKGLFNYARCEFFLENYDLFREAARQYESVLSSNAKMKPKVREMYEKMQNVLAFISLLIDGDLEKLKECKENITPWRNSKAVEGFVHYLKGVAAYKLDDKMEAIYRFKAVEDICSKTVFARLSAEYLSRITV